MRIPEISAQKFFDIVGGVTAPSRLEKATSAVAKGVFNMVKQRAATYVVSKFVPLVSSEAIAFALAILL